MSDVQYLKRKDCAKFLQDNGRPMANVTFMRLACPGSGVAPPVAKWLKLGPGPGRGYALYEPQTLLAWYDSRCVDGQQYEHTHANATP